MIGQQLIQVPAYRKAGIRVSDKKLSLALKNRSKGKRWRDSQWPSSPVTSDSLRILWIVRMLIEIWVFSRHVSFLH